MYIGIKGAAVLQSLLDSRFGLGIHEEHRDSCVTIAYDLNGTRVAKDCYAEAHKRIKDLTDSLLTGTSGFDLNTTSQEEKYDLLTTNLDLQPVLDASKGKQLLDNLLPNIRKLTVKDLCKLVGGLSESDQGFIRSQRGAFPFQKNTGGPVGEILDWRGDISPIPGELTIGNILDNAYWRCEKGEIVGLKGV